MRVKISCDREEKVSLPWCGDRKKNKKAIIILLAKLAGYTHINSTNQLKMNTKVDEEIGLSS